MAKTTDRLQWVRVPLQTRSQESLDRILDAAEAMIAEKGFEPTSVAEIAKRANSSVGAFYGRFREKDDLLRCLHDRFIVQAIATTDAVLDPARWEGSSIADIMAETVPFLVDVFRERRGLLRAFLVRSGVDPEFARGEPSNQHLAQKLRALLLARREEIQHPNPALAIDLSLQAILGTLNDLALLGCPDNTGLKLDDPDLGPELARMVVRYMGAE
ncbi:MAG: TetR/AcrR family transcriptional regulator [Planctomycetota bacterium]